MAKKTKLLTIRQLEAQLKKLSYFKVDTAHKKLSATFTFTSHVDALVFIARITVHAEVMQHHPTITLTHQKVKVVLTTELLKGITELDCLLAQKIETIIQKGG